MVGVLDDRYMQRPGMICNVHPCFDTSSGQVGLRQQELDGLSAAPCVKDGGRSSEREVIHELASIVWTNIILSASYRIIFHHIRSKEHLSLCFTCFIYHWRMQWCLSFRYVNVVNQIQHCPPDPCCIHLCVGMQLHQKVSLKAIGP